MPTNPADLVAAARERVAELRLIIRGKRMYTAHPPRAHNESLAALTWALGVLSEPEPDDPYHETYYYTRQDSALALLRAMLGVQDAG